MSDHAPVLVLGLDGAPAKYVFEAEPGELPVLQGLMARGVWGPLESTIPPITCPAWACMTTSRDPGQLGLYGFRNRVDHTYARMDTANASWVSTPRVWELLSEAGMKSVVLGVPLTYPIKPFDGWLISSFLSPGPEGEYTHPPELAAEIESVAPGYQVDVRGFRTEDKEGLLRRINHMTDLRFDLAEHLMRTRPWDLFWMVEMGTDRMHHGFWRYDAPEHRLHIPGHKYEGAIREYYRMVDGRIGRLLGEAPEGTTVLVVSDHGARTLTGAVSMNDWLHQEGYLALRHRPSTPAPLDPEWVDWPNTKLWAEGGYYARIFVNGLGREPHGIVPSSEYFPLLDEVTAKLAAMRDHEGRPMNNKAYRPAEIYREVGGIAPDLIVYLGELAWRSAGSVGHRAIHLLENDTGPDDANHSQHGVFVLSGGDVQAAGQRSDASLLDVAPTIMALLGRPVPHDMVGRDLRDVK